MVCNFKQLYHVFLFHERKNITFSLVFGNFMMHSLCKVCKMIASWMGVLVCTQQKLIKLSCEFNIGPYQYNIALYVKLKNELDPQASFEA